ncbi:MAG: hypothetical protein SFU25_08350 [Candidatus Caenarcaniphilales bacterium]|nr:hypothetical protein [Candidatus Caenarcaniphilales bacterium]
MIISSIRTGFSIPDFYLKNSSFNLQSLVSQPSAEEKLKNPSSSANTSLNQNLSTNTSGATQARSNTGLIQTSTKPTTSGASSLNIVIRRTSTGNSNQTSNNTRSGSQTTSPPPVSRPTTPPVAPPQTQPTVPPTTPPRSVTPPVIPPAQTTTPKFSVPLSFDPAAFSPGEAYARIARLENNEKSITYKEQISAAEVLTSSLYKQTPLSNSSNIVFLSNPSAPAANEAKAMRELELMAAMPSFQGLFKELKDSGQKIVIMVSNYGTGFAAGNVNLTDASGKPLNVITLDPNYLDYEHNNPYKRNVLAGLSNELHEIAARISERRQGLNYVATRPFQEATLAVDQLMENFITDFSRSSDLSFSELNAQERSNALSLMKNWTPELFASNLNKNLVQANNSGGYAGFGGISNYNTALKGVAELNKKLDYLLGASRKVEFTVVQKPDGTYSFVPTVKSV